MTESDDNTNLTLLKIYFFKPFPYPVFKSCTIRFMWYIQCGIYFQFQSNTVQYILKTIYSSFVY
jgi:hypothetical protein